MGKKNGKANQSRKARGKLRASTRRSERTKREQRVGPKSAAGPGRQVAADQAQAMRAAVSGHAGLVAMTLPQRVDVLAACGTAAAVQRIATVQSMLDLAGTRGADDQVERQLLREADAPWAHHLIPEVGRSLKILPPRAMTQLVREALEFTSPELDVEITLRDVIELAMSITTENTAVESPMDVDPNPNPDALSALAAEISSYDLDQTAALHQEYVRSEIANFQSNLPVMLELAAGTTFDSWFTPWPEKVTDPRLGESPAASFALANSVDLLDVMAVGKVIVERIVSGGQLTFTQRELVAAGCTDEAVEFVVQNMSLTPEVFRRRLTSNRSRGSVADQRYVLTERPFLDIGEGRLLALRYQWAVDRFFGAHLYWQTFFAFGRVTPGSKAEAFSLAMNDVFERAVGETLRNITSFSTKMTTLVTEPEMQALWTIRGDLPSVCDFLIPTGRAVFLAEATNHHLDANLAQGLGTAADYEDDISNGFAKKFRQLAATGERIRTDLAFGVEPNPSLYPMVVVPDSGVPNLASVILDWRMRSAEAFTRLRDDRASFPPVPVTIGELSLFEGLAEHYGDRRRDIADLLGGWIAETARYPVSLREYIDRFPVKTLVPTRIVNDYRNLWQLVDGRIRGRESQSSAQPEGERT